MPSEEKERYALCPECGLVLRNNDGAKNMFCIRCGNNMLANCPNCAQPIRYAFAIYCDSCGHKYVEKK